MIAVAVAGAAGRMGTTVCDAIETRPIRLVGRARKAYPSLDVALDEVLPAAEVVVDFTQPDSALANALRPARAGVHVGVSATTGFGLEPLLDELRSRPGVHTSHAPRATC